MNETTRPGDGSGNPSATPVKRATVNSASPLAFKPSDKFKARPPQPTNAQREFVANCYRQLAEQRALEEVKRTVKVQVAAVLERELGRIFRR